MDKCDKRYFIEAHIVNHTLTESKSFPYSKYVEYELMLNTKYRIWTIFRRYSKFEELHYKLSKYINNLPTLPKKAFFNFSEKLITERKVGLQNYLNQLFHKINFYNNKDLLEFIEIDREVLLLMTKFKTFVGYDLKKLTFLSPNVKIKTFNESYHSEKLTLNEDSFSDEDSLKAPSQVINEFLDRLENVGENKIKTVDYFVSFLKSTKTWPNIKKDDAVKLLFGDMNQRKGLIYHCGTVEENRLGAEACLKLFGKLISFEFNPDCELYVQILKKMPLNLLKKLNLEAHIVNNNRENCFKILNHLKDERESLLPQLIEDKKCLERFETWTVVQ